MVKLSYARRFQHQKSVSAELWRLEVQDHNATLLRFSSRLVKDCLLLCPLKGDKERMEGGKGKEDVRKKRGEEEKGE